MNIIIADTFKKDFLKIFKKENNILVFVDKIRKAKLLNLEKPFQKFKLDILSITTRGIVVFSLNNNLVPIFIVKKSNKKYGNNLIITNEIQKILEQKYLKNFNDIKNNNFQIYN